MATYITEECINCGACEPECPNEAISEGEDIYVIDPKLCTECVGFHDHEACAAVCPVDCCVPDPKIPETHEVLLARARALHPSDAIPDDAPSRFHKVEAPAAAADAPAAVGAPAVQAAAVGAVVYAEPAAGLAIPSPEEWEVPIHCFRCDGSYAVPYENFQAGVVFRCPFCASSTVPTLSMVQAVRESIEAFYDKWATAFEGFHEKRSRDLAQFEERQRQELEVFQTKLKRLALRERAPGAPQKRKPFFSF
jgi:Pyruvate/2-oxoacid:ferredoxin oxidoreductase delta subunit